jgi:hypothetical protein
MSTNPDQVMQMLSWFLVGRVAPEDVKEALVDSPELGPESTALVKELREELSGPDNSRAKLQPLVRETIEAIAHGD